MSIEGPPPFEMEFNILLLVQTNTEKLWGLVPCTAVPADGVIGEFRLWKTRSAMRKSYL